MKAACPAIRGPNIKRYMLDRSTRHPTWVYSVFVLLARYRVQSSLNASRPKEMGFELVLKGFWALGGKVGPHVQTCTTPPPPLLHLP